MLYAVCTRMHKSWYAVCIRMPVYAGMWGRMRGEGEGKGMGVIASRRGVADTGVKASGMSSNSELIGGGNGRISVRDIDRLKSGEGLASLDWLSGMDGAREGANANTSSASEPSLHGVSLGAQELSSTHIFITVSRVW